MSIPIEAAAVRQADAQYIAPTYARFSPVLVSGKGAVCTDADGKTYVDFTSGIGVNTLGYSNDGWVRAISAQASALNHTSNLYYTQPCAALAQQLCLRTGMCKVFFANSGAEANEGAIKAARKYASDRYGARRHKILTLKNSFHGRTITTLAATGQDSFHTQFTPLTEGFSTVEANDTAALRAALAADDTVCALMIECIQGEGGVVPLTQAFVREAVQLCAEKDILLVADEVQTGIGRTGTLLCCEQYGVQPDIITVAKGLGGGLPIGGVLLGAKTEAVFGAGDHGSTYGGNPIACAGALYVLEQLTAAALTEVTQKGNYMRKALAGAAGVGEMSGMGLMLGIAVTPKSARTLAEECAKNGLLVLTAKDKLRLLPPLNISYETLDVGLAVLKAVLAGA